MRAASISDPLNRHITFLNHDWPDQMSQPSATANHLTQLFYEGGDRHFLWMLRLRPPPQPYWTGKFCHRYQTARICPEDLRSGAGGHSNCLSPVVLGRRRTIRTYRYPSLHVQLRILDGKTTVLMVRHLICFQGRVEILRRQMRNMAHLEPAPDQCHPRFTGSRGNWFCVVLWPWGKSA